MAITKAEARKLLGECPEDKIFWVNDGKTLKKLADLETALKEMSDDTFSFHANENKNDFAKWSDEVIGDPKLAADLKKAATRLQAARAVGARISSLLRVR